MISFREAFLDELEKTGGAKVAAALSTRLTPQSTSVKGYSYDPKSQSMLITFKSGATYRYKGITPSIARAMGRNKSVGKTVHRRIKQGGFEYEKVAADLSARGRGQIKDKNFALAGDRYPIHDRAHARNALARVSQHGSLAEQVKVRAKVHARYPGIGKKANDPIKETIKLHGITIAIEWRKGEMRRYYNHDPLKARSKGKIDYNQKMHADYGYIKGVIDADGEELDVYLGPNRESVKVFVLEKLRRTDSSFDENKIMLGYDSLKEARASYLQHQGKDELGSVYELSLALFKQKFLRKNKFKKHGSGDSNEPLRLAAKRKKGTAAERIIRGRQGSAMSKQAYTEKGSFTHDSKSYDLNKVLAVASSKKPQPFKVADLIWVLSHDTPDPKRVRSADVSAPVVITPDKRGRMTVVDGLHRLAKASAMGLKSIPGIKLTKAELTKNANGDMMAYFAAHPGKLKEKRARDVVRLKKRRAGGKYLTTTQKALLAKHAEEALTLQLEPHEPLPAEVPVSQLIFDNLTARAKTLSEEEEASQEEQIIDKMAQKRRHIAKLAGACVKTLTWGGLTMKFEYLIGQERSGIGAGGKKWSRKMKDCYGYIPGTYGKGADGEAIDVYFSPDPQDGSVYKIRQLTKEGKYDEDKFMVGYSSSMDAKAAFSRNMPKWAFGDITEMSMKSFRTLVGQEGNNRRVPKDGNAERERARKAIRS